MAHSRRTGWTVLSGLDSAASSIEQSSVVPRREYTAGAAFFLLFLAVFERGRHQTAVADTRNSLYCSQMNRQRSSAMDVIAAIHGRRSVRSYDTSRSPAISSKASSWTRRRRPRRFAIKIRWRSMSCRASRASPPMANASWTSTREHRPDGPGWDWLDRPGFKIFWDAPVVVIISGPVGDCNRAGQNFDAVGTCTRIGNVLGWFADALAQRPRSAHGVAHTIRADAGGRAVPRLSRRHPGSGDPRTAPFTWGDEA